jgi:hypothetical protein
MMSSEDEEESSANDDLLEALTTRDKNDERVPEGFHDYSVPDSEGSGDEGHSPGEEAMEAAPEAAEAAEAAREAVEAAPGGGGRRLRVRTASLPKPEVQVERRAQVEDGGLDAAGAHPHVFVERQRAIAAAAQPYVAAHNAIAELNADRWWWEWYEGWWSKSIEGDENDPRQRLPFVFRASGVADTRDGASTVYLPAPPRVDRVEASVLPALYYKDIGIPAASLRPWEVLVPPSSSSAVGHWEASLREAALLLPNEVVEARPHGAGLVDAETLAKEAAKEHSSLLEWDEDARDLSAPPVM